MLFQKVDYLLSIRPSRGIENVGQYQAQKGLLVAYRLIVHLLRTGVYNPDGVIDFVFLQSIHLGNAD
jgi:hypothetical protein